MVGAEDRHLDQDGGNREGEEKLQEHGGILQERP